MIKGIGPRPTCIHHCPKFIYLRPAYAVILRSLHPVPRNRHFAEVGAVCCADVLRLERRGLSVGDPVHPVPSKGQQRYGYDDDGALRDNHVTSR